MILFQVEDSRIFAFLLKSIIPVNEEVVFEAGPSGIVIKAIDPGYSLYCEMVLLPNFFQEYYGVETSIIFSFNAKKVFDLIKRFKDVLVFEVVPEKKIIIIVIREQEFEFDYYEEVRIFPKLNLTPVASVTFKTEQILPIIRKLEEATRLGVDIATIRIDKEKFSVSFTKDEERLTFKIPKAKLISMDVKEEKEWKYNPENLIIALGRTELSSITIVTITKEQPLKVEYPLIGYDGNPAGSCIYYLAPKAEVET
jgi:DNA polymerase III sliding clamp (beta) subunit (PCNA family)